MQYLLPYSEKKGEIISYAIFDLDHFKKINDQYGHVTGDWVIKNVIVECQKVRNDNEKITYGRLGGEEFAIIIRDSSLEEMIEFAEACRQRIEQIDSSDSGYDIPIKASFGVTTTEKSGFIHTDLMRDADKALYHAKNNGRNQVIVFDS
jgi:diguanylate cyclase (GGDEF)-like protein